MPEVAPRNRGAGLAVALRIERLGRSLELGAAHVNPTSRQPSGAVPAVPRRRDTVEEVHPARDPLEQIGGKADSPKITGGFSRQPPLEQLQDAMHHRLWVAPPQPPHPDARPPTPPRGALQPAEPGLG